MKGKVQNGAFLQFFAYSSEVVRDKWQKLYIFWKNSSKTTIEVPKFFRLL